MHISMYISIYTYTHIQNLNSLPAHDFSKLSLIEIEAYNTHHNFDMICLPETYLDCSYADGDTQLNLKDFTLIRAWKTS